MTAPANILVAGIGNIFLGDDAFGSEVAQRLLRLPQPPGVRVIDFGIRGLDLMYALNEDCDLAILIDAVPRGEAPGTLFLIEPQIDSGDDAASSNPLLDAHSMDPLKVLRSAAAMGTLPAHLFLIGCQPSPFSEDEEMQMEMSAPVRAAIDEAVLMVQQIVARYTADRSDKLQPAHSQELSC